MTAHDSPPSAEQRVLLNGEERLTRAASLLELVSGFAQTPLNDDGRPADGSALGIAVAVDGTVAPRGRWAAMPVRDGAVVEILTAKKGG